MKKLILFVIFFQMVSSNASLPPQQGKSILIMDNDKIDPTKEAPVSRNFKIPSEEKKISESTQLKEVSKGSPKKLIRKVAQSKEKPIKIEENNSNLPSYYQGVDRRDMKPSKDNVQSFAILPQKLKSVKVGDMYKAIIEQEIKASPSVPTPVRAQVITGALKGEFFVGEAVLDRELKRVLITFSKLRVKESTYSIKASSLSMSGSVGLEGEYESQAGKFFIAELASATASGIVDSTISRNQNALGNYQQEPSLANSAKSGAVTALSKTTDRMAEQVRAAPEFTKLNGFQEIQIIVQDQPLMTD